MFGLHEPYIRCVNTASAPASHLTWKVPIDGRIDISFLQGLVTGTYQIPEAQCGVIKTNGARSKGCGKYLIFLIYLIDAYNIFRYSSFTWSREISTSGL